MSGKKLNYNKWDSLQLSDDSDIEVHPNVDKKSMIRWKQRDIHEKRELRKLRLVHLGLEKTMNEGLLKRMDTLAAGIRSDSSFLEREASRLRAAVPDFEGKTFKDGEQPSEDHMVLSLVLQVAKAVKESGGKKTEEQELAEHKKRLEERQVEMEKERLELEAEGKKYITSEDLHMGFESKTMISDKPSVIPQGTTAPAKQTAKKTETVVQTLNSPSSSSSVVPASNSTSKPSPDSDADSDEEADPLSPAGVAFSQLPSMNFEVAYKFISAHPELLNDAAVDSLLVEAFSKAMKNEDKAARNCVEKSLMIQYCLKLGRDGVSLFFRRMGNGEPKSLDVFVKDVKETADRLVNRAHVVAAEKKEEQGEGTEQIQLVATGDGVTITFEVPDGPPPENLEITGEGSEKFDIAEVKAYLQRQWDIYSSFPKNLQKALKEKSLEAVNKCLAKMGVDEAEEVVHNLQEAGILSFDQSGDLIRDETKPKEEAVGEEAGPLEVELD